MHEIRRIENWTFSCKSMQFKSYAFETSKIPIIIGPSPTLISAEFHVYSSV